MRRSLRTAWIVVSLGLAAVGAGCTAEADVSRGELEAVVARDSVSFVDQMIPAEVLDWMAANRVIVLGETHHLREHWDFTATVLGELHERGFSPAARRAAADGGLVAR